MYLTEWFKSSRNNHSVNHQRVKDALLDWIPFFSDHSVVSSGRLVRAPVVSGLVVWFGLVLRIS